MQFVTITLYHFICASRTNDRKHVWLSRVTHSIGNRQKRFVHARIEFFL